MGIELAQITNVERSKFIEDSDRLRVGSMAFDFAEIGYEMKIRDLGIAKRSYFGDLVTGIRAERFGMMLWVVLTPEAAERGFTRDESEKLSQYSRQLREEVAGLGLPVDAHISFVKPKREQALTDYLDRKYIYYEYADIP